MKQLSARKKFLETTLESTRKSYYPQLLKQLENSKENAKSLQLLIDSMPALISYIDNNLRFVLVNRAFEKVFECKRESIIGKNFSESFKNKGFKRIEKYINLALSGKSGNFETELEIGKLARRWYDFSYVPYIGSNGEVNGFYTMILDLTERKEEMKEKELLKDRLRQSQKMEAIGTLASGIAHDFNNILSGIFGYTQLIKNSVKNNQKLEGYVENVIESAKRASSLIQQILTFSRQSKSTMQPVRIDKLLNDALIILKSTIPSTIEVKEEIRCTNLINADSTQIHQVIMNLCTNAYHAMNDSGGILRINLDETEIEGKDVPFGEGIPGKKILLSISDTGCGIEPENLEKIFDPYFTTKEVGKGTGLGLSVVRGIVRKHGGFIKVDSEREKGTTFKIYFPIHTGGELKKKQIVEKEGLYCGNERIMLVDDEKDILSTLKVILEGKGYRVETFKNAPSALEEFKMRQSDFDIVVTDMTMPKMKGDIFAAELVKIKPEIPVIVITGYLEEMITESSKKKGIRKFIHKPVLGSDLAKHIREVFDGEK